MRDKKEELKQLRKEAIINSLLMIKGEPHSIPDVVGPLQAMGYVVMGAGIIIMSVLGINDPYFIPTAAITVAGTVTAGGLAVGGYINDYKGRIDGLKVQINSNNHNESNTMSLDNIKDRVNIVSKENDVSKNNEQEVQVSSISSDLDTLRTIRDELVTYQHSGEDKTEEKGNARINKIR